MGKGYGGGTWWLSPGGSVGSPGLRGSPAEQYRAPQPCGGHAGHTCYGGTLPGTRGTLPGTWGTLLGTRGTLLGTCWLPQTRTCSFSGDIQTPPGRGAVQPALGDPAWAGGWAGGPTEVPSNPCHAGILGFCDSWATMVLPRRAHRGHRRKREAQAPRSSTPGGREHPRERPQQRGKPGQERFQGKICNSTTVTHGHSGPGPGFPASLRHGFKAL